MPHVCAYRLPLSGDGPSRFREACAVVRGEVTAGAGVVVAGDAGSVRTAQGASVDWHLLAGTDPDACLWSVWWETPDHSDVDTRWTMAVDVGLEAGRAWVTVQLGLVCRGFRLSRLRFGVEPPPMVLALARALPVHEDGRPLAGEASHASEADATASLAELLLDPQRALPVVVVSVATGPAEAKVDASGAVPNLLVDAGAVARTVLGVAHVMVLDSVAASYSLTRRIGPRLSVFGGAVRLYWPGLAPSSEPRHHPLWPPEALGPRATASLRRALVNHLMPVAVARFSGDALRARLQRVPDEKAGACAPTVATTRGRAAFTTQDETL